ncbi:MAG: L,D-transpeptidase family protein [Gammaproteobacteria bacterium]
MPLSCLPLLFACNSRRLTLLAVLSVVVMPAAATDPVFEIDAPDAVIGAADIVETVYEDTLLDIGRKFGLGYEEITLANPTVDPWVPGDGTTVRLPTQFVLPAASRKGLVINIAEYRLYYFYRRGDTDHIETYPISIGRMDWNTPLGRSSVVSKVHKPTWYPPASVREEWAADGRTLASQVPPGPDNPLGDYALRLSIPGYLIHGTNRPAGVGMRVTHGCVRMFPEDIEFLYPKVSVNTPVRIVNQPFKMGWLGDDLYLEVHQPLDADGDEQSNSLTAITQLYVSATRDRTADVDWQLVESVYTEQLGIPVRVGKASVDAVAQLRDELDRQ